MCEMCEEMEDILVIKLEKRVFYALQIAELSSYEQNCDKAWIIDQMVRTLLGSERAYKKWVSEFECGDGHEAYKWNVGVSRSHSWHSRYYDWFCSRLKRS